MVTFKILKAEIAVKKMIKSSENREVIEQEKYDV